MSLVFVDVEVDAVARGHAAEVPGEAAHGEQRRRHPTRLARECSKREAAR